MLLSDEQVTEILRNTSTLDAVNRAYRLGMLRAVEICRDINAIHREYVGSASYLNGNAEHSATCGRRDESARLAFEIELEANRD